MKKTNDKAWTFMGKNKYFYINLVFAGFFTFITFHINKFIASTSYISLGIAIMTLITIFLAKLKDFIDENDPSSTLGKAKIENSIKDNEIQKLKEKIEDRQARINSLVLTIQNSQSLKKLQGSLLEWYVNSDNECYYGPTEESKIKDANQKAINDISQYLE